MLTDLGRPQSDRPAPRASGRAENHPMSVGAGPGGLFRLRHRFLLVGIILSVITAIAAGQTIWDLREDAIANYREYITNLSFVIAEQTARSLQAVDLVVQEMREKVLAAGVETPEQFNRLMATKEIHHFLVDRLKNLPQAVAVDLVGTDGYVVSSSHSWPPPVANLTDRDYYAYFLEHDDPASYISAPAKSRATGNWSLYLARRVSGPHGDFLGLVQTAVELRSFEEFYRRITLEQGGSVTLLRRDGTILARYPRTENQIGKRLPSEALWYQRVEEGGGSYRSSAYADTSDRVVSVEPLRDFPLVVDVTITEDKAFAHWRRHSALIAGGALCSVVGFAILFRALTAQFRRREDQTAEIIEAAEALHDNQRMLRDIIDQFPAKIAAKDRNLRFIVSIAPALVSWAACRRRRLAGYGRNFRYTEWRRRP
jgi:hypothetical protein